MTNSARVIFYISIYIERIYSEKSDKPKEYIGHHDPFALLSSHILYISTTDTETHILVDERS